MPSHWINIELHKLLNFVIGGDWGKDIDKEVDEEYTHVKCIRGSEIRNWKTQKGSTASLRKIKTSSLDKRKLKEGDILLEISGGGPEQPVGRTIIIDEEALAHDSEIPKVCTNFLRLLRPSYQIESYYLNYYLTKFYLSREVVKYQGGSNNLRNLKYKEFEQILIPLPPLREQKRIVAKLDALITHIEYCKEKLAKVPALLKAFRQSVLAQAVSGKLTEDWRKENPNIESANVLLNKITAKRNILLNQEIVQGKKESKRLLRKIEKLVYEKPNIDIPEKWIWTCFLESSFKVVDCHNKTAPYVDEGILLLRTTNIKEGKIKLLGSKFITQETYDFWSKRCPPKPNDILFTREAPMGEAAIIPEGMKVCMGQRMMLIRTIPNLLLPKYLLFNILSSSFQQRMTSNAVGSGVKHLRVGDVEKLTFPLAPLEEQEEIVKQVEILLSKADAIEAQYHTAVQHLDALPLTILVKAFKGELVDQDKTDEPVKALLQKIKEEQDKLKKEKKSRKVSHKAPHKTPNTIVEISSNYPLYSILIQYKDGLTEEELFSLSGFSQHLYLTQIEKEIDANMIEQTDDGKGLLIALKK